jgi:hypothetical protein
MRIFIHLTLLSAMSMGWFVVAVEVFDALLIARSHPIVLLLWSFGWCVLGFHLTHRWERFWEQFHV